jgi:hypothetical protein
VTTPDRVPSPPPSDPAVPRAWRLFALPAVLALVGYLTLYFVDAHLRVRRGPWEVTFDREADGTPTLRVDHRQLGIAGVRIRLLGEQAGTNAVALPAAVRFDRPRLAIPFGKMAFDDLMYLPGTVVLHCYGHEVQMLPRRLYLDRQGRDWTNGSVHDLRAETKPAQLEPPPRTSRLRR